MLPKTISSRALRVFKGKHWCAYICESPNEPNAIRPGLRILLFHSSFCSNSDQLLSALISSNLMFNIPLALMMLAALIILTFWIEIHARCAELTRQSGVATVSRRTFASSCAEALLSKTGMCAPSSLTFKRILFERVCDTFCMFTSSLLFTGLFLSAGHVSEMCQVASSCPGQLSQYFYNIVVIMWLLQYVPLLCFLSSHACCCNICNRRSFF